MNQTLLSLIVLCLLSLFGHDARGAEVLTRTFKNTLGYSVTYPACWQVANGEANDESPLISNTEVSVEPGTSCPKNGKLGDEVLGLQINVLSGMRKAEARKMIDLNLLNSKSELRRRESYLYKEVRFPGVYGFAYVERGADTKSWIRWSFILYCENHEVHVTSSTSYDISKARLEKFEKGDLATPEPVKSIVESIKCKPPK